MARTLPKCLSVWQAPSGCLLPTPGPVRGRTWGARIRGNTAHRTILIEFLPEEAAAFPELEFNVGGVFSRKLPKFWVYVLRAPKVKPSISPASIAAWAFRISIR